MFRARRPGSRMGLGRKGAASVTLHFGQGNRAVCKQPLQLGSTRHKTPSSPKTPHGPQLRGVPFEAQVSRGSYTRGNLNAAAMIWPLLVQK